MKMAKNASLQDFSLLMTNVDKISKEKNIDKPSAFMQLSLDLLLDLQDDEIDDAITDNNYLKIRNKMSGHDRGIDAIYIDETQAPTIINIFNFKFTEKFEKIESNFPSNEIDKIISFLDDVLKQDEKIKENVNTLLFEKIKEIWTIYQTQIPVIRIHICSNLNNVFESNEKERFERDLKNFSNITYQYTTIKDLVKYLTKKNRMEINGKIKMIDLNYFEKSDGDVRALIGNVDVKDLIRIVLNDEAIRTSPELDDYKKMLNFSIENNVFEDNVRIYLKQRSRINRNIKETALSDENFRFFYFNNGITLTCSKFNYVKSKRAPVVELYNFQVVNGCQTINALFEAFNENSERFTNMDVLCRIYETTNDQLSIDIAENTNSQNPVKGRDIRSNDIVQKKLEKELELNGLFYERKKGQHRKQDKVLRIDAEKAGQAILSFFGKMPTEAKNNKQLIFGQKYEDVFTDKLTAKDIMLAHSLLIKIEQKKLEKKKELFKDDSNFEAESYILHTTYYILYTLSEIADKNKIEKTYENIDKIFKQYTFAVEEIKKIIESERSKMKDKYSHRNFFKTSKPRRLLSNLIYNGDPDKEQLSLFM